VTVKNVKIVIGTRDSLFPVNRRMISSYHTAENHTRCHNMDISAFQNGD
jgi:hypothetical protein